MRSKSGFTLVEILIVVVILGILAAIVIPQFTEASEEARYSSLVSDLQTMRSQIELYKIQHKDDLPGAGTASFIDAMTKYTDIDGALATTQAPATGVYGPYMQKMPTNPFDDLATVDVSGTGTLGDDSHGWEFDTTTGAFYADDSDATAGVDHDTL